MFELPEYVLAKFFSKEPGIKYFNKGQVHGQAQDPGFRGATTLCLCYTVAIVEFLIIFFNKKPHIFILYNKFYSQS